MMDKLLLTIHKSDNGKFLREMMKHLRVHLRGKANLVRLKHLKGACRYRMRYLKNGF